MDSAETQLKYIKTNLDEAFKLFISFWIIFMQCGFALLEAGSVRSKNTTNILFKNLLDIFVGALSYWVFGYAFAYGQPGNAFIGHHNFFSTFITYPEKNTTPPVDNNSTLAPGYVYADDYYASWVFQFAFAATSSTIVSGAMAERTQFAAYLIYSFTITGLVYPVVSHWCWSEDGFLHTGAGLGVTFIDYAGSGVVHVTGGVAALVGAKILGPRMGRFPESDQEAKDEEETKLRGHSVPLACMGGFILFSGFLAFNGGSKQSISNYLDGLEVSMSVMNTVLAGSAGALSGMITNIVADHFTGKTSYWSLLMAINGGLTGMVSSCAGSNDMYPWSAILTGMLAGVFMILFERLMEKMKIDDPLGAGAVHLVGGLVGTITAPIFVVNGLQESDGKYIGGIIYGGHPKAFATFGWNLLGSLIIIMWSGLNCLVLFLTLKMVGLLRVTEHEEKVGLDIQKHGEPAYPESYQLLQDSTAVEPQFSVRIMNPLTNDSTVYSDR